MIPGLALALGGGAARGPAHVGALIELELNGIVPEIVTGTSTGSLVGSLYAGGLSPAVLARLARRVQWRHISRVSLSRKGWIDLKPLGDLVNALLRGRTFSELPKRLGIVAVDLLEGKELLLTEGDIGLAVRASCAIPGIFRPVRHGDLLLVDGGVLQDIPVRAARMLGARQIIAVDLHGGLSPIARSANVLQTSFRALEIMVHSRSRSDAREADIVIAPDLADISQADLTRANDALELGREAARAAMPAILSLLDR